MQIPRSNGWQGAPGPEALDEQAATSERQLGRLTVMMEEVQEQAGHARVAVDASSGRLDSCTIFPGPLQVRSSRSPELSRHQLEGSPSVRTSPVVSTVAVGERTDRRPLYSPGSYVRGSGTDAFR